MLEASLGAVTGRADSEAGAVEDSGACAIITTWSQSRWHGSVGAPSAECTLGPVFPYRVITDLSSQCNAPTLAFSTTVTFLVLALRGGVRAVAMTVSPAAVVMAAVEVAASPALTEPRDVKEPSGLLAVSAVITGFVPLKVGEPQYAEPRACS